MAGLVKYYMASCFFNWVWALVASLYIFPYDSVVKKLGRRLGCILNELLLLLFLNKKWVSYYSISPVGWALTQIECTCCVHGTELMGSVC